MNSGITAKLVIALALGAGAVGAWYTAVRWNSSAPQAPASPTEAKPASAAPAIAPLPVKQVEKLEIDLDRQRVMVPGEGWLSAQAFWEIYYAEPQKLPGDIDFAALREFEALTAAERARAESLANPPPAVADVQESTLYDNPIPPDQPAVQE